MPITIKQINEHLIISPTAIDRIIHSSSFLPPEKWILMGILNGIYDIFKIIYEEGEKEWLDETKYKLALSELYMKLESKEITESEYEEEEEKVLEQLRAVRKYKKENGYTEKN